MKTTSKTNVFIKILCTEYITFNNTHCFLLCGINGPFLLIYLILLTARATRHIACLPACLAPRPNHQPSLFISTNHRFHHVFGLCRKTPCTLPAKGQNQTTISVFGIAVSVMVVI
jgi:hypothetical protein